MDKITRGYHLLLDIRALLNRYRMPTYKGLDARVALEGLEEIDELIEAYCREYEIDNE